MIAPAQAQAHDLIAQIAEFITNYRANKLDPSAMMMAVGRAFPGSTMSHYATGLARANQATLGGRK